MGADRLSESKSLSLPKLDRILKNVTVESTALKLMEEAGELGAAISRLRGAAGIQTPPGATPQDLLREVALELLDVAQTAVTMMFVLEDEYGLDTRSVLAEHIEKLTRKGYLTPLPRQADPAGGQRDREPRGAL